MTKNELKMITDWLIENIVMNPDIMYPDAIRTAGKKNEKVTTPKGNVTVPTAIDLVAVIVYLHNRLYEEIAGEPYNYMFHWANKIGSYVDDEKTLQDCKYVVENDEEVTNNE